jgi:hypothetical protein
VKDSDFASALACGLIRFAKFLEAKKIKLNTIRPTALRTEVGRLVKKAGLA